MFYLDIKKIAIQHKVGKICKVVFLDVYNE